MAKEQLTSELEKNPDKFPDIALELSKIPARRAEARELCFRGLADNPNNLRGRLILAKLFYLDSLYEFSVRELIELRRIHPSKSLDNLIASFGALADRFGSTITPEAAKVAEKTETVVGELDIEDDFIDALEQLEE